MVTWGKKEKREERKEKKMKGKGKGKEVENVGILLQQPAERLRTVANWVL